MYHYGDIVRVIDDISEVYMLQAGHGEWNDDIALVRDRARARAITLVRA